MNNSAEVEEKMAVKQVIVMRRDLKMRRGKECAQAAHASMKVLLDDCMTYPMKSATADETQQKVRVYALWVNKATETWLEGGFTKVCVRVDSEEELLTILKRAEEAKLPTALITDSGRTEFHGVPTNTCCAIGPAESKEIDKITGHLKLY